jgi:MarR family transcriptional regulator, organic hydroperoxide resistance regulator
VSVLTLNVITSIIDIVSNDLKNELKQTKPFRSLGHEAHLAILRTAAELEHSFELAVKPHGITATQYNVLRILRGAGPSGLCRNEVGTRMLRRVPDVTRLLDRLEDMKLISRERGGDDRRYVTTRITAAGLKVLGTLDPIVDELHDAHLGHLGDARLRTLVDLLARVRDGA